MSTKSLVKNAIGLHREMYERRCRERTWFQGQTLTQIVRRINTMPLPKGQLKARPNDGKYPSS